MAIQLASMRLSRTAMMTPRSGIRNVFDEAGKIDDVISLAIGEPSHTAAAGVAKAGEYAIEAGDTHYTDVLGSDEFRERAADYERTARDLVYDPETEICAVPGATYGLFLSMRVLLDPGDEVIVCTPAFPAYDAQILLCGATPVHVQLKPEHQMHYAAEDIQEAITPRTRAIILNSPGNPSGAVTSYEELAEVAQLCIENNLWAVSDEVYHPFVYEESMRSAPSIASVPGMHDRTVVVESMSKSFGMTGWRIGYLLAPEDFIERASEIAESLHSSVNTPALRAATQALSHPHQDIVSRRADAMTKRALVLEGLKDSSKLSTVKPEGALYVLVDVSATGLSDEEFSEGLLRETHVAVVPGAAFGDMTRRFVRVSYAGEGEEIEEGIRRMKSFAQSL
ncbi:pyridoxal phosphate-dependent aminotransferase [Bifidobacterium crudilactis]|jgi:aminotransferase|uniref:pyridoxal phosphate-dependent aminotransferase n=1 Tax=Bifidobacterium crudilactis TaxID=327277 RepID=UPI00068A4572|nr:pyridoxal phosphate-dependent aminotransferase [Bifidobacterium crudilactis]MCI2148038.1 pyridoxal phosphate-dependent aminotransferase [Bifidobacterium crudilactis]MCI2158031.1 pyridoxal phosphate-dependent aminotransferase [Bifidobacterium crudilactis]